MKFDCSLNAKAPCAIGWSRFWRRSPCGCRSRQQTRADPAGHDDDRRGVPHGYVRARQAAGDPSVIVENKEFGESEPERDERQAEKIAEDTPARRHERKACRNDWDLRGRTSSWPADIVPRKKAGHMIANSFTTPKNPLAKKGRSLIASPLSMVFCRRPGSRFSPRSE
jgi:hypothetical protein